MDRILCITLIQNPDCFYHDVRSFYKKPYKGIRSKYHGKTGPIAAASFLAFGLLTISFWLVDKLIRANGMAKVKSQKDIAESGNTSWKE